MRLGYPFEFVGIDMHGADELMVHTMLYRFKSDKSHRQYVVHVERYIDHAYCIKFFDEENIQNRDKYSLKTGTYEPRTIFYTLMEIMLDVLNRDARGSFFFIGAEDEKDEPGKTTRRYRIYSLFAASVAGEDVLQHFRNDQLSLYILVNKKAVADTIAYKDRITNYIKQILFG